MSRMPSSYDELHQIFLDWRGIEPDAACEECRGTGVKIYGSTATWRGGVGGQAMTQDVCDHCWGSGDRFKPWPSRRQSPDVSCGKVVDRGGAR